MATFTPTVAQQFVAVDVTSLVQGWVTTPSSNYGIALSTGSGSILFDSKENGETSHMAKLDITLVNQGSQGEQGPQGAIGTPALRGHRDHKVRSARTGALPGLPGLRGLWAQRALRDRQLPFVAPGTLAEHTRLGYCL